MIIEILEEFGEIHPERLAANFGTRFIADPQRGYGHAMHSLLPELADNPQHWKKLAPQLFKGSGSFGNGAAMRVAPIGAFFADDLDTVVKQAALSAMITHSHPEGIAGALAVALAAALAWRHKSSPVDPADFLQQICERIPMSEVHLRIAKALALLENTTVEQAASVLGSGAQVSAQDTVPFCLWAAALHLNHYEEAMWATVSGLGAIATLPALSSVESLSCPPASKSIPPSWIKEREPIPVWFLYSGPEPV